MRLPFLQVDGDFLAHKARPVASLLGCSKAAAVGHLTLLWAWAVSQGPEDAAPTGLVVSARAAVVVASAAEWEGSPAAFVDALADGSVGLLEVLPDGIRIRGLDRYAAAWDRQRKERTRKADYRKRSAPKPTPVSVMSHGTSAGQDADGVGQIKTQTQKKEKIPPTPLGGEGVREEHGPGPQRHRVEKPTPSGPTPPPAECLPFESGPEPHGSPVAAAWNLPDAVRAVHREVQEGRDYAWDVVQDERAATALMSLCSAEGLPPASWPAEIARRFGRALVRSLWKFERGVGKAVTLRELARRECWAINAEAPTREVDGRDPISGQRRREVQSVDPWEAVLAKHQEAA